MSIRITVTLAAIFSLFSLAALAAPTMQEQEHEQLRLLLKQVKTAVNEDNIDALIPLLDENFAITMVNQTLITNVAGLKEYFYKIFKAPDAPVKSVHIEPEADVLTQRIDSNTGIDYGHSTDTYTLRDGRQIVLNTRWSATLVQQNGQWKIKLLHVGVDMLNNPILNATEQLKYWWGVGGLLIGLVAGWWLRRRRKLPAYSTTTS